MKSGRKVGAKSHLVRCRYLPNGPKQIWNIHRLGEVCRELIERIARRVGFDMFTAEADALYCVPFSECMVQFEPVAIGEAHVGNEEIERLVLSQLQRLGNVAGNANGHSLSLQKQLSHPGRVGVILGEKNAQVGVIANGHTSEEPIVNLSHASP